MTKAQSDSTVPTDFDALRRFSARVGSDLLLTQAAGGNTSAKVGDTLWIKASGTWLAHAMQRNIFVPVDMPPLIQAVAQGSPSAEQAQLYTIASLNRTGLRPSIETTVHALMPQRIVAHVHCVDTIALAVRTDAVNLLQHRLQGLNWAYVPYCRPGLPLAQAISQFSSRRPDILVLGNHGLVVAAETVEETSDLLNQVKSLLRQPVRSTTPPRPDELAGLGGPDYRLPTDELAHLTALSPTNVSFAAGGSLYPDHVIFLGIGSVVARAGETAADVAHRLGHKPISIIFPGLGILMRRDASEGAEAMARCLADVVLRIQRDAPIRYLSDEENSELTDWDAEKYRQTLNLRTASTGA